MVIVVEHKRTGKRYILPNFDYIPSEHYKIIRRDITEAEAKTYLKKKPRKQKC